MAFSQVSVSLTGTLARGGGAPNWRGQRDPGPLLLSAGSVSTMPVSFQTHVSKTWSDLGSVSFTARMPNDCLLRISNWEESKGTFSLPKSRE